ncbi:hypothetical protein GCM10027093_15110 [Paraburkholderia jirisanensis]
MSDEALDPLVQQLAEKRLGRALSPQEQQVLLEGLRHNAAGQPASAAGKLQAQRPARPAASPPLKTRQEAREQMKHFLQLNQQKAYEKMRGILQSIEAQNEATLQVLESEQRKVAGMLDEREMPEDSPASSDQPAAADPQDSNREALMLIGNHLTELIRQEVEKCFQQHLDPLAEQVRQIHASMQALCLLPDAPPAPAPTQAPAEPASLAPLDVVSDSVHAPAAQASLE